MTALWQWIVNLFRKKKPVSASAVLTIVETPSASDFYGAVSNAALTIHAPAEAESGTPVVNSGFPYVFPFPLAAAAGLPYTLPFQFEEQ